jgi:hydroxyacylglutathione hydrolase
MLSVKQIYTQSPLRNYTYLIHSEKSGEAVCIDPFSAEQIINLLNQNSLKLKFILNTHEHKDHVAGNLELKQYTKARIFGHPDAASLIPGMDDSLKEGDVVFEGEGDSLVAWETPGHTFCHFCFALKNQNSVNGVFSGDTLFNFGVGNCYRGGDPKTLYSTLKARFQNLSDDIKLYPGHDYVENNLKFAREIEPTNEALAKQEAWIQAHHTEENPYIGNFEAERALNPFFNLMRIARNSPDFFSRMDSTLPKNEENLFLYLRSVRDKW